MKRMEATAGNKNHWLFSIRERSFILCNVGQPLSPGGASISRTALVVLHIEICFLSLSNYSRILR